MAEAAVPNVIRLAGEPAVRAYREFIDDAAWSPRTRKDYRQRAGRFFRWAESHGLSLETIDAAALGAYADEIRAETTSAQMAPVHLTPVRGVFRRLASSGVLAVDPCPKGQPNWPTGGNANGGERPPETNGGKTEDCTANCGPGQVGLPLLDLLAMLRHVAEPSLSRILDEEAIAVALVQQVRWPDGPECPHCGAAGDGDPTAEAICPACAKRYSVTTGTMFEGSPVPVHLWLVVMQQMYLAESALPDEELRRRFGLGIPAVLSLCRRIGEAVMQQGLPIGDELTRALDVRNRELGQEACVRSIIDCGRLQAERERLVQARAGNTPADGLPPGMTLEQALAWVEARLAEHDNLPGVSRLPIPGLVRLRLAGERDAVLLGHRRRCSARRLVKDMAAPVTDHSRRLRHPLTPPPFPGRHRIRLAPQTDPRRLRRGFKSGQPGVMRGVPPEPPGHALPDHLAVQHVAVGEKHLGHCPPVPIGVARPEGPPRIRTSSVQGIAIRILIG